MLAVLPGRVERLGEVYSGGVLWHLIMLSRLVREYISCP